MVIPRNPFELIRCRRGATATEYIVMLILTALFVLGIIRVFGDTIKDKYVRANSELSGTLAEDDPGPGTGGRDGSDSSSGAGGSGEADGASGSRGGAGASGSAAASGGQGGKGGKGSGVGGSGSGGGGSDGAAGSDSGGAAVSGGTGGGGGLGGCGGDATFNPAILLAAFLMIGLLLYVMFKGKDG